MEISPLLSTLTFFTKVGKDMHSQKKQAVSVISFFHVNFYKVEPEGFKTYNFKMAKLKTERLD